MGVNLRGARQGHAREGHLCPARKRTERLDIGGVEVDIKLGAILDNTRRRADRLTPERRAELDRLDMRWEQPPRRTGGAAGLAALADWRATRRYAGRLEQGQVGSWPFL
ncbi:hypothetical protein AB0P05_27385 [Streptomyces flaveolus]|uniref:hypothetical protein n=1 Tax=Streptomyces flaveolus TaxID=67297 RepID=UPI00344370C3